LPKADDTLHAVHNRYGKTTIMDTHPNIKVMITINNRVETLTLLLEPHGFHLKNVSSQIGEEEQIAQISTELLKFMQEAQKQRPLDLFKTPLCLMEQAGYQKRTSIVTNSEHSIGMNSTKINLSTITKSGPMMDDSKERP
jgi:hypothetical protein